MPLNKIQQAEGADLSITMAAVENACEKLQSLRETSGENILLSSKKMALQLQLENIDFKEKRSRKRKRLDMDECGDDCTTSAQKQWTAEVFYTAIDTALNVLAEKFQQQKHIISNMRNFLPINFKKLTEQSNDAIDVDFVTEKFGLDADIVKSELKQFAEICISHKAEIMKSDYCSFATSLRYILKHGLQSVFPQLLVIYHILSTIPSSSAECERTFSKMKIK